MGGRSAAGGVRSSGSVALGHGGGGDGRAVGSGRGVGAVAVLPVDAATGRGVAVVVGPSPPSIPPLHLPPSNPHLLTSLACRLMLRGLAGWPE